MKKLPTYIDTFSINPYKQTIRYKKLYEDEMYWSGEDWAKTIFCLVLPLIPLCIGISYDYENWVFLKYVGIILGIFLTIWGVGALIINFVVTRKKWEKEIAETNTVRYACVKAIYKVSRDKLIFELDEIRNKENPTIAEREYYEKYKEIYNDNYVEYLDIPLWDPKWRE